MYLHLVTFSLEKTINGWKISKVTNAITDIPQGRVVTSMAEALFDLLCYGRQLP